MKTFGSVIVITLLALAAVACGGSSGSGGVPPTPLSGQDALDAQATLAVWSAQGTAIAESTAVAVRATADAQAAIARATSDTAAAWATGTAVAAVATSEAAAMATGVAAATATTSAGNATATWDALVVQEKAISVQQTADAGAYYLAATATADAGIAAFMEAEAAQTIAEREAEAARRAMWTRLTPWLLGAVVVAAVGLVFLVVGSYMVERVRRVTPQAAGDTWVMWHPDVPRVIAQPQPALPRFEPRALLPEGAPAAPAEPEMFVPSDKGHVLVAGESESGKSTALRSILGVRQNVVVLDPHWDSKDWGESSQVIGGGRDFQAIKAYMDWMTQELQTRYQARLDGRAEFQAHTVVIDEMPAIIDELGRAVASTWRRWLREGRKVGLYLVVSTQSTRVETLGIKGEGDLLENFSVTLVLGKQAVEEYRGLVAGMARPAVLHTVAGARPVIIPNIPAVPRPAPPRPAETAAAGDVPPPIVYATTEWPTRREETAIDLDNLAERDKQRIADEYYRTLVIAQVQAKLFPDYASDGGKAGRVIRLVLAEKGLLERYVDDRGRPAWRPTAKAFGLSASDRQPTGPA